MINDLQKQRLAVLAEVKERCAAAGIATKDCGYGVLLLALPEYGEKEAEQILIEATEPGASQGGDEGRPGEGGEQGA